MEKEDRDLLIRIDSNMNTLLNRGCPSGEEWTGDLHKRINGQNKWVGLAVGLGVAISQLFSWMWKP